MISRLFASLCVVLAATSAWAKNVDLVTLPARQTVQLTIYNTEDITLAKETRFVTLKRGANKLQFSWAGTLIDPTSVEFRPLAHADKIEVADTVFPGQKPQHLIWNIESTFEGQVPVEVSYFTSGLTWQMDYVSICNPAETRMQFRGYVRVFNRSGEEYENAEIRLIVGKINLVEKIADLARRYGIAMPQAGGKRWNELKEDSARRAFHESEKLAQPVDLSMAPDAKPKRIVKEGVSEYFMFSVEGTETIRNGWSKRMRAVKADDVKFDIVYRMRAYQYGPRPVRFFIWQNDEEHKLGDSPLPNGRVRIFRDNGRNGLSYLGEQLIRYVPIKAEIEINLGPDDLIVYQRRKTRTTRFNFQFRFSGSKLYVVGWDERQDWVDTIRNYHPKPIKFELRLRWSGDVEYESEIRTTPFDYRTLETRFDVKSHDKTQYKYTATIHHGQNARQNRVRLKKPL